MIKNIIYPTPEKIIEYNLLTLTLIKVRKADQPKVLNLQSITNVIEECKHLEGDIYDKAVCLIKRTHSKTPIC